MWIDLIAEALGLISGIPTLISVQLKSVKKMLIASCIGNLLIGISYLLQGGASSFWLCMIGNINLLINLRYLKLEKKAPWSITLVFVGINFISTLLSWTGWLSPVPFVAGLCGTIAGRQQKPKFYRLFMLMNATIWFAYDVFLMAWTNALVHGCLLVSAVVGILRQKDWRLSPVKE